MERVFHYYWGAVLIALPLFLKASVVASDARFSRNMFFLALSALSVILFGVKVRNGVLALSITSLVAYCFFNCVDIRFTSFINNFLLVCSYCLFAVSLQSNSRPEYAHIILNALCLSALLQSVLGLLNMFDISSSFIYFSTKSTVVNKLNGASGTLYNPNLLGAFLALSLPAFFRRGFIYAVPIVLIAIYFTYSIGPIVTALFAVLAYLLIKYKEQYSKYMPAGVFVSLSCLSLALPFLVNTINDSGRLLIWRTALKEFTPRFWAIGGGLGAFPGLKITWVELGQKVVAAQAHNEFLEAFIDIGFIGVSLVFATMLLAGNIKNKIFFSIFIAGLVNCFFNFPLHIAPIGMIIILALFFNRKGAVYV